MNFDAINRSALRSGFSLPLINTIHTEVVNAKFPYILVEELWSNLSLVAAQNSSAGVPTITVGPVTAMLWESLVAENLVGKHLVFTGAISDVAKMVTGPLSGIYIGPMKLEQNLFEAFSLWSHKVTVGGNIIIYQQDISDKSTFKEHIIAHQNFTQRKWGSLFFGPDYISIRRMV